MPFICMGRGQFVPSPPVVSTPSAPAPPHRADAHHNLPFQATPFVGRQTDLTEISELLANPACRLLTLVGVGGIGKTRLSIEAARQTSFSHGVCFVPLAPLTSADPLVFTIADSVGLILHGSSDPKQQLFSYLHNQEFR